MNMERYIKQHEELLEIAGKIAAKLNDDDLKKGSDEVAALIAHLAGRLNIHLAMEDNVLYPALLKSSNPAAAETAQRFREEMGGIKDVFVGYVQAWSNGNKIKLNPSQYIIDTKNLFGALKTRIDKENSVLYPLAEKT